MLFFSKFSYITHDNIFTGQTGHKSSGELRAQPAKPLRGAAQEAEHQGEPPQGAAGHQLPAVPDWQVEGSLWRR